MSVAAKKAERREHLIELAVEDIVDYGVEGCSFRTLAKRAGTTTAPFTYEFGSRAKMLDAIVEYTWLKLDPSASEETGSPLATLREKARRWTPIDDENAPFIYVYIDLAFHAVHNEELAATMRQLDERGVRTWEGLVAKAQQIGEIDPALNPSDVVNQIWAICDGFALAKMSYPDYYTRDVIGVAWSSAFDRLVMPVG